MAKLQIRKLFENPTVKNTAIGIGLAVVVPIAVAFLAPLVKPVARSTLKAGLVTIEKGREMAAEFGEIFDDLVAEVRDEMSAKRESVEELIEHIETAPGDGGDHPPTNTERHIESV